MAIRTQTLSITSGKGGVGKTTLVCNLAMELARQNKRVLILDGDLGMANVDIMFGQRARRTVEHFLTDQCTMEELVHPLTPNIGLIAGGHGVYGLSRLSFFEKQRLLDQVAVLEDRYDYMLIDTAPGIDENVLYLNSAAQEIVVVASPDPASITDAYALIKVLNHKYRETRFSVVANMVKDEAEGQWVYKRLSDVAAKFLCVSLNFRGSIVNDPNLRHSIKTGQLVVEAQPRSPSAIGIRRLSEKLSHFENFSEFKGGMQFFWQQLSGVA